MASQTLESMLACTKAEPQEKKAKPCEDEKSPKCPRCESTNTKFCYYNNYSLSQPRYFCKSCRRYWTKGGTLRNVPVGGGCRKNKRAFSGGRARSITQDPFSSLTSPPLTSLPFDMPIFFNPNNNVVNTCGNVLENDGFPQNPSTNGLFHNLCHGGIFGSENSNNSSVEWNVLENGGSRGEMGNSYYQDGINNSNYWGFPWQIGGEGNENNGFGPYSWQGLINSPLM